MADLPEEIIEAILLKLPAKSLVRFTSVCKHWLSLISDPNFLRTHLNHQHLKLVIRSKSNANFNFIDSINAKANQIDFPLRAPLGLELFGSVNGLLCIGLLRLRNQSSFLIEPINYGGGPIVLWNPLLKKFNKLPTASDSDSFDFASQVRVGFGYDSSLDDYKFVIVIRHDKSLFEEVQIYTLRTNAWKTIRLIDQVPGDRTFTEPVIGTHVNGSIYWTVYQFVENRYVEKIRCFDLIDEKLRFLELPPKDCMEPWLRTRFTDVMGVLGVLQANHGFPELRLWTIEEDNGIEFWSKKMVIRHPADMFSVPISFMKNGEVLMINCDDDGREKEHKVAVYNPAKETFSNIFSYDSNLWVVEEMYIETLVSPYGGGDIREQKQPS